MLLAGQSPVDGVVCVAPGKPWGDVALAAECRCTVEELRVTRQLCVKFGKILDNHAGITIVNWLEYQGPLPDGRADYYRDYRRRQRHVHSEHSEQRVNSSHLVHNKTIDYRRGGVVGVGRSTKKNVGANNKSKGKTSLSPEHRKLFDILKRVPSVKEADAYKLPELLADYPGINYELEFKKFVEWWPGPNRRVKPWATLRNWLGRINEQKADGKGKLSRTYKSADDHYGRSKTA